MGDFKGIDKVSIGGVIGVSVQEPVLVKLKIDGIDFEKLAADPTLQGSFLAALLRAIAEKLGLEKENVEVKFLLGSGFVEVSVDMAPPKDLEGVKTTVAGVVEAEAKDF